MCSKEKTLHTFRGTTTKEKAIKHNKFYQKEKKKAQKRWYRKKKSHKTLAISIYLYIFFYLYDKNLCVKSFMRKENQKFVLK